MKKRMWQGALILVAGLALAASTARANNIMVTNVTLWNTDPNAGATHIQFDLCWSNSWRASWAETNTGYGAITVTNWDAAWVFVKWRIAGSNWNHAYLTSSGHTAPAGTTIAVGSNGGPTNVGAFIYRSTEGTGDLNLSKVRLRWNYALTNLTLTNQIDVSVHAIEMVYIPQGSFYVGSGSAGEVGAFTDGSWVSGVAIPFRITNETAMLITNAAGYLWGTSTNGTSTIGPAGVLPDVFPKGYAAFYCMKYEVTQGQYTEFLNQLTSAQALNRFDTSNTTNRQTIGTNTLGIYTNGAPDRVAIWLSYNDSVAYMDWAGLRPMTELEFEKACRGPKTPVSGEFAWGNASYVKVTNFFGLDGSGTETADPATANCSIARGATGVNGPVRAGIFATSSSTRAQAGATYFGVMEMTGSVEEWPVTVGKETSRTYSGIHGDGVLNITGAANVSLWPNNSGGGWRGGTWYNSSSEGYVSQREYAVYTSADRNSVFGCRGIRSAP